MASLQPRCPSRYFGLVACVAGFLRFKGLIRKKISLGDGKYAHVDDQDFHKLLGYDWIAKPSKGKNGTTYTEYAIFREYVLGKRISVRMHRLILDAPDGVHVDHIDGNGLNNMRSNLRICTAKDNQGNRRKFSITSSQYKGVCWNKKTSKWRAQLSSSRQRIFVGEFDSELDAAHAYDSAALQYFGEFARVNTYEADK